MDLRAFLRKVTWSKPLLALFLVGLVWSLSLFIVPFTLSPGTVANLNGWANRVDYADLWYTLPPYPMVIYFLGDAQCHQISDRTIYLNGNEMPVDARDVSIYVFGTVALFGAMFIQPSTDAVQTFMRAFPRRFRETVRRRMSQGLFIGLFIVLMLLPVALDGTIQLLTEYESTNVKRVLTGIPAGIMAGLLLGSLLLSMRQFSLARKEMERRMAVPPEVEAAVEEELKNP